MSQSTIVRRLYTRDEAIFFLGPGGASKSTTGSILAQRLDWRLIDLDFVFCDQLGLIGPFIAEHGYERYRAENLKLAQRLCRQAENPYIFITPSGFLAAPADSADHNAAQALIATSYGIVLLPSPDIEIATPIVVQRQLSRGFDFEAETEEQKFRERFTIYRDAGDLTVFSTDTPEAIAETIITSAAITV